MTRQPDVHTADRARSVGLAFAGVGAVVGVLGLIVAGGYWLLLTGTYFVVVGLLLAGWSTVMR